MAMQDPAGGGRLIVVDTGAFASDTVVYTVAEGKTFVGFVQSAATTASNAIYRVNGVNQVTPFLSGNGVGCSPLAVTWPAGTVITKASISFYIQGNEI